MTTDVIEPLRLEIPEAAEALRLSRSELYKKIRAGSIAAQKDGKRTFITVEELRRYVRELPNIRGSHAADAPK